MSSALKRAAIAGVGHSPVMRYDDVPLGVLAVEAARLAIEEAGLEPGDIDGVFCAAAQPFLSEGVAYDGVDYVTSDFMARTMGMPVRIASNGASNLTLLAHSLVEAVHAVEAGLCDYALLFRALRSPRGTYGQHTSDFAAGPSQFTLPYGEFVPPRFAQLWSRYQGRFGTGSREQMATFVMQERQNGLLWEHGYWAQHGGRPITREEYLDARMVSWPFSLLDCDMPVHGAGAFIVTSAERARDLRKPPAYVLAKSSPFFPVTTAIHSITLEAQEACARATADELWTEAGLHPADVDVANLYDGFSILPMLWMESLGFCAPGEAFEFIQDGRIALDGELPIGTAGGSLGSGRMHGVPQLMDSVLQLRGESGPRQVSDAEVALVTIGYPSNGGAALLSSQDGT